MKTNLRSKQLMKGLKYISIASSIFALSVVLSNQKNVSANVFNRLWARFRNSAGSLHLSTLKFRNPFKGRNKSKNLNTVLTTSEVFGINRSVLPTSNENNDGVVFTGLGVNSTFNPNSEAIGVSNKPKLPRTGSTSNANYADFLKNLRESKSDNRTIIKPLGHQSTFNPNSEAVGFSNRN